MNPEPTHTIYNCLGPAFWTKRQCSVCQKFFTLTDYHSHNYQLFFWEVGQVKSAYSLNQAVLEGVIVELRHRQCTLFKSHSNECQIETVKDIIDQ